VKVVFDTNVLVSALVFPGGRGDEAVVTGDKAFLALGQFRGVRILSLVDYLAER
jgi:predicted nucleic acid-binding protein